MRLACPIVVPKEFGSGMEAQNWFQNVGCSDGCLVRHLPRTTQFSLMEIVKTLTFQPMVVN